jgi:hypothetical protein
LFGTIPIQQFYFPVHFNFKMENLFKLIFLKKERWQFPLGIIIEALILKKDVRNKRMGHIKVSSAQNLPSQSSGKLRRGYWVLGINPGPSAVGIASLLLKKYLPKAPPLRGERRRAGEGTCDRCPVQHPQSHSFIIGRSALLSTGATSQRICIDPALSGRKIHGKAVPQSKNVRKALAASVEGKQRADTAIVHCFRC